MQVSVEKLNNVEQRLTIVVPVNQVEEAYAEQIKKLAKNSNLKGFRKGKAPIEYIRKRFGNEARGEAYSEVIQQALYQALTEHKLKPIGTPRIEPKVMSVNEPLEFIAYIETLPEINQVKFDMKEIEKLNVDIKDSDVTFVIDQLKKQHTEWQVIESAAKEKHRVVIDYHSLYEGKEDIANKVQDFPLELGSKIMLPGFEEGLIGALAGDEKTLNLQYPEDFANKDKAGKSVDFVIQVKKVYEAKEPEMNAEFIKQLGISSGQEEDLQQQIKKSLEQERNRLVKEKLKEQVFRQLLEQNPLEVPMALVKREAQAIHDEIYADKHHHHEHSDSEMQNFEEMAKKRVKLGLLIGEYVKQHTLKPDQDKVKQRIQEISEVYENSKEVAEWLASSERRSGIEAQILEDQVIDKLIEGIPVTLQEMSYAELKGIRI